MGGAKTVDAKDLVTGGVLQCLEAATVGMPFEVWKTYMGTYRTETTTQAFRSIYAKGGVSAFWKGWQPKMVESFLKGGILLFSKDAIIRGLTGLGVGEISAGFVGGFGGGVCQVSIMGPCTYLITASVAGASASGGQMGTIARLKHTMANGGVGAFYKGGTALMMRQGSNWASRQGITDFVRMKVREIKCPQGSDPATYRLSVADETLAGTIGGVLSTWNQPFEVMRIDAQARAARGLPGRNIFETSSLIVKENGIGGLFRGIIPRAGLCVGQTFFMISMPYILKDLGLM